MKKLFIIAAIAVGGLAANTAMAQVRMGLGLRLGPETLVPGPAPMGVAPARVYQLNTPAYNQADQVYNQSQLLYGQTQLVHSSNDNYYYLPDVGSYYKVNDRSFYYFDGKKWISAPSLPGAYRNYDLKNAPKYEIRASQPYLFDDFYRSKYYGHIGRWAEK